MYTAAVVCGNIQNPTSIIIYISSFPTTECFLLQLLEGGSVLTNFGSQFEVIWVL